MKNLFLTFLLFISLNLQAQELSPIKQKALAEAVQLEGQTTELCQKLWDYSETALLETQSAELLINVLEKEGFQLEKNVAGMPTAFMATWGSGKPKIGILAEYDALPGVGNEPIPKKQARDDGVRSGHGCGHNLFGSASVNAAIAAKRTMEKNSIPGTIVLYGTPAEETLVGKVYMAAEGVFDDMDAVLEWHPMLTTQSGYGRSLAMNNFEVEFFGQAAHGAADPWNGRSALDAVEMMNYAVNMMREHIPPTARMHYVIPNAGEAPNVVPEYAKVWYYVRDTSRGNVEAHYERLLNIAKAAALATNTTHKVTLITGVHEYNINEPLIFAIQDNLNAIGPPKFTDEENDWGKKLQKACKKEPTGFDMEITTIPDNWQDAPASSGSTDVAEVSFITPTAGFTVASAPEGVPWHSWATSASHGTSAAHKSAIVATKVLTLSAVDLLTKPELRKAAKEYFLEQTKGKAYHSPLPEGQKVILPE